MRYQRWRMKSDIDINSAHEREWAVHTSQNGWFFLELFYKFEIGVRFKILKLPIPESSLRHLKSHTSYLDHSIMMLSLILLFAILLKCCEPFVPLQYIVKDIKHEAQERNAGIEMGYTVKSWMKPTMITSRMYNRPRTCFLNMPYSYLKTPK